MCGIIASIGFGDREALQRMTDLIAHRGPDDAGLWCEDENRGRFVGLGSRRLAILDLTPAGHMPMISADGNYVLVYNGEIYNYRTLRNELEACGHHFRSNTDSEVILHGYRQWGVHCVSRFNGMFAFALWDRAERRLFFARDHFGIKPLYYTEDNGRLALASELKSLLLLKEVSRAIDFHALDQYFSFLWVPEPATIFKHIRKLLPGHYGLFRDGNLRIEQYWDLRFPREDQSQPIDPRELVGELRARFAHTVKSQLVSDVPVGAFLSAGMDSSSIVANMAGASSARVHTYTISFPLKNRRGEVALDDPRVAARTARHFDCVHTDIVVNPDAARLLPRLVWHMDEPVADPAIITAYLINREARKSVTVLLSGIGGDEVFGGYRKYQAHYLAQKYQRLPRWLRLRLLEPMVRQAPILSKTPWAAYMRFAKKMLRSGSLPPQERFIMDSVYLSDTDKVQLYRPELYSEIIGYDPRHRHLDCFAKVAECDFLNQMLYLDTKMFLPSLNLNYNDKMSMASSAEVRVPFLDWEFVQWAADNVPPSLKIHGSTTKYILRQAMEPLIPAEVLTQAKAGFGAPIDQWLRDELRPMVEELLSDHAIRLRGMFDPGFVRRMIEEHYSGSADRSFNIWQLLTLELWFRQFVDAPPA